MNLIDNLKSIGKILQEAGKIEQYKQILEAREELLEMQEKINNLKTENVKLQESLKIKEDIVYENNAYWLAKEGDGKGKDGPYCVRCWDKDKNLLRMLPVTYGSTSNPIHIYKCPECETRIKRASRLL